MTNSEVCQRGCFFPEKGDKNGQIAGGNYEVTYWFFSSRVAQRVTVCKSWHLFLENWMGCYNFMWQ